MKIKVLHIINGYWSRDLYSFLIKFLIDKISKQTIFVPIRNKAQKDKFKINSQKIKYVYALIVSSLIYRLLFYLKIIKSINIINREIDVKENDIIHAHTLFSDGAIANYYKKNRNIPFIVAVRNTDVNIFFKYMIHLRSLGKRILINSEKIVFLSHAYKDKMLNEIIDNDTSNKLKNKAVVIPNGIDNFWHRNKYERSSELNANNNVKVIFVGAFNKNKNLMSVIKSIEKLHNKGVFISLKAIGIGMNDDRDYLSRIKKNIISKKYVKISKYMNKESLINEYRNSHIFIMPSHRETFGLAYAEALTQGLPVLYTQNQGFDKFFPEGYIGYSVDPKSVNDISEKLELLIKSYTSIQPNCLKACNLFRWEVISEKYANIYNEIKSN